MNKQRKNAWHRIAALAMISVLLLTIFAMPALAMGRSGHKNAMGQRTRRGFFGRTADDIENGAESILDGVTDIPNAIESAIDPADSNTESGTNATDPEAETAPDTEMADDESLENGTNIPDEDIGGAVADNDNDGLSDAKDPDDDNDGVRDPVDTDADGDGMSDDSETTGIIGIVIAVAIVIAIIVLVLAVIPRAKKR